MAPRLRSSSRTTSRNNTRPSSSHSAPVTRPSSSDTTRPKKQRKTSHDTRSPVDVVEEEGRQAERKPASKMDTMPEQPEQLQQSAIIPTTELQSSQRPLAPAAELPTGQGSQHAAQQSEELPADQRTEPTQQTAAPRADPETWVEPTPRQQVPTFRDYGLERGGILASMMPLGQRPNVASRRKAGLATPPRANNTKASKVTKRRGGRSAKPKRTTKNDDERPSTASTSAEDAAAISDSSRAEEIIQGVLEREEQSAPAPAPALAPAPASRITRSRAGKDKLDDSADSQSVGQPAPSLRKFTSEKLLDILGSAILRAEESQDSKVAGGLRWIKEASASDPFLLETLEGAINGSADAHHRSAFQVLMRDAVKRVQNQPHHMDETSAAATEMVRTRSATTTSSLSTAKSLDADAFAPAAAEQDPANASTSVKGKGAKATKPKAKGKGRAGPSKANAVIPTNNAFSRKRKLEDGPEFSEEAVAAKRMALETATNVEPVEAEESNVRTAMEPPQGWTFPAASVRSDSEVPGTRTAAAPAPKDKAPSKPAGVSANNKRVRKPRAQMDEIDNIDFCRACGGNGQLLCCDGCVDSFHFTCLQPPVDPNSPPAGQWFCPVCEKKGLLGGLAEVMDCIPQTAFQLPAEVRNFFAEVETGAGGEYKEVRALPKGSTGVKVTRQGRGAEEVDNLRIMNAQGKIVACIRCGLTSENRRPVIQCDYCPSAWHLDCLDPPMANPPRQRPGSDKPFHYWKCPNHIENTLAEYYPGRVRRPRNPKYVDIEVLPDYTDEESVDEQDREGVVYRVRESGIVHDFITYAKSKRAAVERARERKIREETRAFNARRVQVLATAPTFEQLRPVEQQAVMGLMDITGCSEIERAEQVVSGLIAGSAESFRNATNEVEVLRVIHELVGKRLQTLTPASESTN